ncbi:kinesin-like protein KIN-8A [Tanacetum coccineum]
MLLNTGGRETGKLGTVVASAKQLQNNDGGRGLNDLAINQKNSPQHLKEVYLTEFANENDYLRLKRLRGQHFTFDASFPDTSSQLDVYSTLTSELIEAVLQGRNGLVFCYGATGAGKTFTMLEHFRIQVYNETVRDLLSPGRPLALREDKQHNALYVICHNAEFGSLYFFSRDCHNRTHSIPSLFYRRGNGVASTRKS